MKFNYQVTLFVLLVLQGCVSVTEMDYAVKPPLTEYEIKILPRQEVESRLPFQHPLALYQYTQRLVQEKSVSQAAFWFYAAQIRGRTLAVATGDKNLQSVLGAYHYALNDAINEPLMKDANGWISMIDRVIEWDKSSGNKYRQTPNYLTAHDEVLSGLVKLKLQIEKKYARKK